MKIFKFLSISILIVLSLTGCKKEVKATAPVIGDATMKFRNADDTYWSSANAYLKAYFYVEDANGLDTIDFISVQFGDDSSIIMREDGLDTIENTSSTTSLYSTNYYYNGLNPDQRPVTASIIVRDDTGLSATKTIELVKPDMTPLGSETFIYTEDYADGNLINGVSALQKPTLVSATKTATQITLTGLNTNDINANEMLFWFYNAANDYVGYYLLSAGAFPDIGPFNEPALISNIVFQAGYSGADIAKVHPQTRSQSLDDGTHFADVEPYLAIGELVLIP